MNNKNPQKGFTILVAVVTAGILLIIAMSIGGIALKEQVLSTANKESQIAFYAADTGIECMLYLDLKVGVFAYDTYGNRSTGDPTVPTGGYCNGQLISFPNPDPDAITADQTVDQAKFSYIFQLDHIPVGNGSDTCAIVRITKDTNNNAPQNPTQTHTFVQAYGYNTCGASLTRLERGIEGHY